MPNVRNVLSFLYMFSPYKISHKEYNFISFHVKTQINWTDISFYFTILFAHFYEWTEWCYSLNISYVYMARKEYLFWGFQTTFNIYIIFHLSRIHADNT